MRDSRIEALLHFTDPDGELETVQGLELLGEELCLLDIEVRGHPVAGRAPDGTRLGELTDLASLALTLAGAPALRSLIQLAQDWLARRNSGTVDLKIGDDELHLTSASRDLQRQAVEAFLARHSDQPPHD